MALEFAYGLGAERPIEAGEDLNNDNEFVDIEENNLDEITVSSHVTRTLAHPPSARTRK
jgi:hypothetical protein